MRSHQRFLSMLYCISFMSMRPSNFSRNLSFQFHAPVCYAKDTLKAFDDFKDKQISVWSIVFWYVKICIFWKCIESVFNTLYIEIKHRCLKKFFRTKYTVQKCPRFFFRELQRQSTRFLSLKLCGIFHFRFRFVFIKVHIFVLQNAWTHWL